MDTSAFVAGFDPLKVDEKQVTAPKVEEEIRSNSMMSARFAAATESGKLLVRAPSERYLRGVEICATEVGDLFFLSETDKQVLALALELKVSNCGNPQIVTDDYSIQNVAKRLGIESTSLVTFGIRRVLEWMRYCPACHKEYPANYAHSECETCGTQLKRKPRKHKKA